MVCLFFFNVSSERKRRWNPSRRVQLQSQDPSPCTPLYTFYIYKLYDGRRRRALSPSKRIKSAILECNFNSKKMDRNRLEEEGCPKCKICFQTVAVRDTSKMTAHHSEMTQLLLASGISETYHSVTVACCVNHNLSARVYWCLIVYLISFKWKVKVFCERRKYRVPPYHAFNNSKPFSCCSTCSCDISRTNLHSPGSTAGSTWAVYM